MGNKIFCSELVPCDSRSKIRDQKEKEIRDQKEEEKRLR